MSLAGIINKIRASLLFFTALIMISGQPVSALGFGKITLKDDVFTNYTKNNIVFYNKYGCSSESSSVSGKVNIQGAEIEEKIWSGLTSLGYSKEQAAGILGNMKFEGGLNPARHEESFANKYKGSFQLDQNPKTSYGIGLIQWSFGRRISIYNYIKSKDESLLKYLNDPVKYSIGKSGSAFLKLAGQKDTDRLIALELEFLDSELKEAYKKYNYDKAKTVEEASEIFLRKIERPAKPDKQSPIRLKAAQEFYKKFQNHSYSKTSSGSADSVKTKEIVIIGDSITNGSRKEILDKFRGMSDGQIDAKDGRQWSEGESILKAKVSGKKTLVFALGTNSDNLTESQIDNVVKIAGSKMKIVLATNYTKRNKYEGNNQAIKNAAARHGNIVVADWQAAIAGDLNKYLSGDGVHPNNEGKKKWAEIIYDAVNDSEGVNESTDECAESNGEFYNLLMKWAWPEFHNPPYSVQKPEYKEIISKRRSSGKYIGGNDGNDCGGWVSTLLSESGADPSYNSFNHARKHWKKLGNINPSELEPGDVAYNNNYGHTFIYVGDVEGFGSKVASASFDSRGMNGPLARSPMAGKESLTDGVVWYRNPDLNKDAFTGGSSGFAGGGMSKKEADKMMAEYKKISNSEAVSKYNITVGCGGINIKNCTSFSAYFVAKYTGKTYGNYGNGNQFVNQLAVRRKYKIGTKPKPYAIFSTPGPSKFGHTGAVFAVNGDRILIGEAGCSAGMDYIKAKEMSISEFNKRYGMPSYAYLTK